MGELNDMEFDEVIAVEETSVESEETSALHKALDILKGVLGVEAQEKKLINAVKGALRILGAYVRRPDAPDELKQAVALLAKIAGYKYPYPYPYPEPKKTEKEEEPADVELQAKLEKASRALLKALSKVWADLPPAVQKAARGVAAALGYPEPYEYGKVKKSEAEEALEKELAEVKKALEEKEIKLLEMELAPLVKELGLELEQLIALKKADETLFKTVTEKFKTLKQQVEQSGIFKEQGTVQQAPKETPSQKLIRLAEEKMKERKDLTFSEALSLVSADLSEEEIKKLRS